MSDDSQINNNALIVPEEEELLVIGRKIGAKGDSGVGIDGETGKGFVRRGAWSSATAYVAGDLVVHRAAQSGIGSAYVCLQAHTNKSPKTEKAFWAPFISSGEAGPEGPGGANFTGAPKVGVWRGAWATGKNYNANDLVLYKKVTYICILGNTSSGANEPDTSGTHWQIFAGRGAQGPDGARGKRGNRGAPGIAGPDGPRGPRAPGAGTAFSSFRANKISYNFANQSSPVETTLATFKISRSSFLMIASSLEGYSEIANQHLYYSLLLKKTGSANKVILNNNYLYLPPTFTGTSVGAFSNSFNGGNWVRDAGTWSLVLSVSSEDNMFFTDIDNWRGYFKNISFRAARIPLG